MKYFLAFTLIVISVGFALLDFFGFSMGDDLEFWAQLGLNDYTKPNRNTLSFIAAHIFGCNGRLFDYMGPVIINLLPKPIAATVMGLMAGLFFYSLLYACGLPRKGRISLSMLLITTALFVMPWWDSLFLRVCHFNYLWGTTFCLLFIGLWFQSKQSVSGKLRIFLISILGVLAGATHEQTGVAMCVAFFLFLLATKQGFKSLTVERKSLLIGLIVGTMMSTFAPGIWARAAGSSVHQDFFLLVLTTIPVYLCLVLLVVILMLTITGRKFLKNLQLSWVVLLLSGGVSGVIALLSGVPGRTGMFSEACALVVFAQMLDKIAFKFSPRMAQVSCVLMLLLISSHFAVSVSSQIKFQHEFEDVKEAYINSSDGIVFYDFTNRYDVPWLALNRIKGVADADDIWLNHCFRNAYKPGGPLPVVLPSEFEGKLRTVSDSLRIGNTTVYSNFPNDVIVTEDSLRLQYYPGPNPRTITSAKIEGLTEIWIASPRVRDPGDYNLKVVKRL